MGRRASGKHFTTTSESGLGLFVNRIEKKISQLNKDYAKAPVSKELDYAKAQVDALSQIIKALKKDILPKFNSGKTPLSVELVFVPATVNAILKQMEVFWSPEYAVIKAIESHFEMLWKQTCSAAKLTKINPDNPDKFRQHFKIQIREAKLFDKALRIPGIDPEPILKKIDSTIDEYNFASQPLPAKFADILVKGLGIQSPYTFGVFHPMSYALLAELWYGLEMLPESLDELLSFLDPEALQINLPGMLNLKYTPKEDAHYVFELDNLSYNLQTLYKQQRLLLEIDVLKGMGRYFKEVDKKETAEGQSPACFDEVREAIKILTQNFNEQYDQAIQDIPPVQSPAEQVVLLQNQINTINHLITVAKNSMEKLNQHKGNVTDGKLPDREEILPEYFIISSPLKLVHARRMLQSEYEQAIQIIEVKQQSLQQHLVKLQEQQNSVAEQWHKGEWVRHQQTNQQLALELQKIDESLLGIQGDVSAVEPQDNLERKVTYLQKELEKTDDKARTLSECNKALTQLASQWGNLAQDAQPLHAAYPDLLEKLYQLYGANRDKHGQLVQKIPAIQSPLSEHREALQSGLAKAKSDLEFAESMRSTDLKSVKELYITKNNQLAELEEKQGLIDVQLATIEDQLRDKAKEIQPFNTLHSALQAGYEAKLEELKKSAIRIADLIQTFDGTELKMDFNLQGSIEAFTKQYCEKIASLPENMSKISTNPGELLTNIESKIQKETIDFSGIYALAELKVEFTLSKLPEFFSKSKVSFDKLCDFLDAPSEARDKLWQFQSGKSKDNTACEVIVLFTELCTQKRKKLTFLSSEKIKELKREQEQFELVQMELNIVSGNLISNKESIAQLDTSANQLREDMKKVDTTIKPLMTQLRPTVPVLKQIVELAEGNIELRKDIDKIATNATQEDILACYNAYDTLAQKRKTLLEQLKAVPHPSDYEANKINIEKQLAVNLTQLRGIACSWLKHQEQAIQEEIQHLTKDMQDAVQKRLIVSESQDNIAQCLGDAESGLTRYDGLSTRRDALVEKHQALQAVLMSLKDDTLILQHAPFAAMMKQHETLRQQFVQDCQTLLQTLVERLEQDKTALKFDFNPIDDLEKQVSLREKVNGYLNAVTGPINTLGKTLSKSTLKEPILSSFEPADTAIKTINALISENQQQYDSTRERLLRREVLMKKHIAALTQYRIQRAKAYAFKDGLSSDDACARSEYIDQLITELQHVQQTGDNWERLINCVKQGRDRFPGLTLRPLLRRMLVSFQDNQHGLGEIERPSSPEALGKSWQTLLNNQPELHFKLNALSEKINAMRDYGAGLTQRLPDISNKVINLSNRLQDRLDNFLLKKLQNSQQLPQQDLDDFCHEMKNLAHSEDDTMHSERSLWAPIVVNIAAALVSLGLALAVKLASSKRCQGYATFFMGKTQREKNVDEVDAALDQLAAPAA